MKKKKLLDLINEVKKEKEESVAIMLAKMDNDNIDKDVVKCQIDVPKQ